MPITGAGPKTARGAMVTMNGQSKLQSIPFQYNPANLHRSLTPKLVGGEEGDRSESVRFQGAPVQTISLEAEFDAADGLETGNKVVTAKGIYPLVAALELLIYPSSGAVQNQVQQAATGVIEIAPVPAPLTLFVWGENRVVPVQVKSFSVAEEAFDADLNPIRATVSLTLRVLTYNDIAAGQTGYDMFMAYQRVLEQIGSTASFTEALKQ